MNKNILKNLISKSSTSIKSKITKRVFDNLRSNKFILSNNFNKNFSSNVAVSLNHSIIKNSMTLDKLSELNNYSVMIENNDRAFKIIFPDKKFSIEISPENSSQTIGDLINSHKSHSEIDGIFGFSFADLDGNLIANSSNAILITRLQGFIISIDNGEKNYHCINANYLGNKSIDVPIDIRVNDNKNLDQLVIENNFAFKDALSREVTLGSNLTIRDLLNNIYSQKYAILNEVETDLGINKEIRYSKALNTFFYLATFQVVTLNLCTFVFLNWDIMEPITQCLTFANIIFGYYFWALTKCDYDPQGFNSVFRFKAFTLRRKYFKELYNERNMIKSILNTNDEKNAYI